MEPRHQISRAGITLIKRFEGLRRDAARLDDGRWTVGYGHTRTAKEGLAIDEREAEALLLYDLIAVVDAVNSWTFAPLSQNQFDALVSFAFNIGIDNFRRCATLRRLNQGRPVEAALAMELWRRADFAGERIVVDALVRRRAYEKTLFLRPLDAWPTAPSPVLPPRLDYDGDDATPSATPKIVSARLEGEATQPILEPADETAPTSEDAKEEPLATEAAAAGVAEKLEAILAEPPAETLTPEAEAAAPASEAAPEPARAEAAGLIMPSRTAPSAPRSGGVLPLLLLGVAGIGLFVFAVDFGFRSPIPGAPPFAGGMFGWVFGGAGIVCFALASYLLLLRLLGRGEPPRL